MDEHRTRRVAPAEPGGEPICELTARGAAARRVPIDRLLDRADFRVTAAGYEVRLSRGDDAWALANAFVDEEAACCPAFAFEVRESAGAVVIRAGYPDVDGEDVSPAGGEG